MLNYNHGTTHGYIIFSFTLHSFALIDEGVDKKKIDTEHGIEHPDHIPHGHEKIPSKSNAWWRNSPKKRKNSVLSKIIRDDIFLLRGDWSCGNLLDEHENSESVRESPVRKAENIIHMRFHEVHIEAIGTTDDKDHALMLLHFWLSQTLIAFVSPRLLPRTSQKTTKLSEYFSRLCDDILSIEFSESSQSRLIYEFEGTISSSFWDVFIFSNWFSKWCQESATVRDDEFFIKLK